MPVKFIPTFFISRDLTNVILKLQKV